MVSGMHTQKTNIECINDLARREKEQNKTGKSTGQREDRWKWAEITTKQILKVLKSIINDKKLG